MPDVELAKVVGVSPEAIGQFINKAGGRTDGATFRVNKIHEALGLEVEVKVQRTFRPKDVDWRDGEPKPRRVEEWTLPRPRPRRAPST